MIHIYVSNIQIMEETKDVRIGRYLSGEMTGPEREAFEQQMSEDTVLHAMVQGSRRIWDMTSSPATPEWNTQEAWEKFSKQNQSARIIQPKPMSSIRAWAVAASAAIILSIGGWFFLKGSPVVYAYEDVSSEPIVLKDGSKCFLNKGAEVTVHPFSPSKRQIELKGEAYFEVSPDKARPFIVSSGETITEVVGTSFNIKESNGQASIFVSSGKVIFSAKDYTEQAVALTAGEAAFYVDEQIKRIPNPSPNVNAWRTHNLRFVKMPLSMVVEDVTAYFGQKIIIENEASKECPVNIPLAFKKPEIKSVLSAVAASISAQLVQDGDTYIIRGGKNCS